MFSAISVKQETIVNVEVGWSCQLVPVVTLLDNWMLSVALCSFREAVT